MGTMMLMLTHLVGKISMGKGASATIQRLAIQVSSGFPSVQLEGDCDNDEIGDLCHHNHPVIEILPYFQIHRSRFLLNKGNVRVPCPNLGVVIVKIKTIEIRKNGDSDEEEEEEDDDGEDEEDDDVVLDENLKRMAQSVPDKVLGQPIGRVFCHLSFALQPIYRSVWNLQDWLCTERTDRGQ